MTSNPVRSRRNQRLFLLLFDVVVLVSSLSLLYTWRLGVLAIDLWPRPAPWFFILFLTVLVYIFGGYEVERFSQSRDSFSRLGLATLVFAFFSTIVVYLGFDQRAGLLGRGVLLGSLLVFFLLSSSVRWLLYQSLNLRQRKVFWIFVVAKNQVERLKRDLAENRFGGQHIFIDETSLHRIPRHFDTKKVGIVVGLDRQTFETHQGLFSEFLQARVRGQTVMSLMAFYERFWRKIPVQMIAPEWLVQAEGFSLFRSAIHLKMKRVFDLLLSVGLLILVWPVMLIAGLAVKLESSGPALYRQRRTGRNGQPFVILKFRSMSVDAEKDGAQWAQVSDPRVTRVGSFLRKSRIDELPQIFNVLKGEMSFIGPRPERPEFNKELEKEIPFYELRHLVNPGITGWAQIMYPYGASAEDAWEKLQYDLFYIKNYSFWLDIRIALRTASVMFFGLGR